MGNNLTFNILTFKHPKDEYTFYFTDKEKENLNRVHHTLVPDEVIEHFKEQEHYYTSFDLPIKGGFEITKDSSPTYELSTNDDGEEIKIRKPNTCFSSSILKRFYNYQIQQYFKEQQLLVKPNFIDDIEIWIPQEEADDTYNYYENIR